MITHKIKILLITLMLLVSVETLAHPVIYKGGTDIEFELNPVMNNIYLGYTFHQKLAVAVDYFKFNELKTEFFYTKLNYRPLRINETDSQANIYLSAGLGERRFENRLSTSVIAEIHADWEDRDYYVSAFQKYLSQKDENPLWLSRARVGFSPFRADYNDINIWFIAQFEKMNEEHWETTPLMRTFYKNILWELGASLNGNYQLNFMFHL